MKRLICRTMLILSVLAFVSGTASAFLLTGEVGNFYVTTGNNEVHEYAQGGTTPLQSISTGLPLHGIVISPASGNLFVADTSGKIQVYRAANLGHIQTINSEFASFGQPMFTSFGHTYNSLYVSDFLVNSVKQVLVEAYSKTGDELTPFVMRNWIGKLAYEDGPVLANALIQPTGIAVNSASGHMFIANAGNNTITVLSGQYEYLNTLTFNGQLVNPGGLALGNGSLFVVSTGTDSVLRISLLNGQVVDVYGTGELSSPMDVTLSARNTLLVTDSTGVLEFDLAGNLLGRLSIPGGAIGIAAIVPEPATILLTAMGLGLLALKKRRK